MGLIPVGVLAYGFHEACCTHDLLEADFNTDAGPFLTGENEGFRADLDRGTYRVTAKTDSPALAWVFAWLARPTTTVLTELTVTEPGSGDVGVACLDEGAAVAERGFVFIIGDGEASLVDLQAWDRSDPQPTGTQLRTERERATLTRTTTAPLQGGQRIGISCALGDLEAYLDGELVLTASYRGGGGTRFNRSAFYFDPAHAGDAARFDDVDAHLP